MPAVTAEWIAQPGDARRATLTVLRSRRTWLRTLAITVGLGLFLAALFLIMGTTWWDLAILLAIFMPVYFLLIPLATAACAHLQNRKVLRAGSRWAAGSDATRIRIDNPVNTIVIERANIEAVEPSWAMVILTVRPKQRYAVPAALFSGLLTDRTLRATADDLSL
ncbi:YcxB-like protein [Tsukamurella hominis]